MPSLVLPARDVLRPRGATSIAWAAFDAEWYRATYTSVPAGVSAEAVLEFYFDTGQGLGHSPNILFDEAWHRRAYPEIAARVETGEFASAFDAWCRGGCRERSPHWLFDEVQYRRRNPDLTDEVLTRNGFVNGYDHYLWRGDAEGRTGHPLFDSTMYRTELPAAAADGPFWHCLRRLHQREPEVRMSVCFDADWYLDRYPIVRQDIERGVWRWAIEHYFCNDTPTLFDPVPAFSETWYLARYDDAAAMVRRKAFRNGFSHFLAHGAAESRAPSESIDLARYAARANVQRDLERGHAANTFEHWLTFDKRDDSRARPRDAAISRDQAATLFRHRARILATPRARAPLRFQTTGVPALSVIMVVHDQFEAAMMALGSLRANYPGDIELVLIDSGSTDETRDIQRYVHGAVHFRFDTDIGVLAGRGAALQFATAAAVLYLSYDIELAQGAIAAAMRRLEIDPRIGAVGGMVLRADGSVLEAGSIVWRDGSTEAYGRDSTPLCPEVNFVRDVDFCSSAFLVARRTLLNDLDGFDASVAAAGCEDADLCIRMKESGYRVVYDPAAITFSLDDDSALDDPASEDDIDHAHQMFRQKHAAWLARRPERGEGMAVFARMADTERKRVLFVEDTVPLRMIGSGYVRSNDIVREMAAMGYAVTVYPLNGSHFHLASVYADMPDTVEVMHDRSQDHFQTFLTRRRRYYDVVWVARIHNLITVRTALGIAAGESDRVPAIVLDTEAIGAVRYAEQAALEGRAFDLDAAASWELRHGSPDEKIVAVSEAEAAIQRGLGFRDVSVVGHMRAVRPTPRPFAQRAGMLFVGAIHHPNSPNYDSLCWFIDEVLPLIVREMTWQTRLTVVGYTGSDVSLERFRAHPRVTLRGTVTDLEPLYDSHRVFVAPTRIAAGAPYKVHEAASFGLPVVATELLRRQLGWVNGGEILTAEATDPMAFARQTVTLQQDEALWLRLRNAAMERLRQENNQEDYAAAIADVLGPPLTGG